MTLSYGLAAIALLVRLQLVTALTISGLKLPLDPHKVITAAPIGLLPIAIFTDYALVRTSSVLGQITNNAVDLLKLNPEAKPVTIGDMHLFGAGITGLILALARWPLHRMRLSSNSSAQSRSEISVRQIWKTLVSFYKMLEAAAIFLIGVAIVGVLCLPFLLVASYLLNPVGTGLATAPVPPSAAPSLTTITPAQTGISLLLLALGALSVFVCGLRLFAYYSVEYIEAFGREFADLKTIYVSIYVSILRTLAGRQKRGKPARGKHRS